MRALDANIVLRMLLGDDPAQSAVAEQQFQQAVFIPLTVLLEVGWVLRSRYGFERAATATFLRAAIDHSMVTVEAPSQVAWAIERYRLRGDLPDMIHLVAARHAICFVTFDTDVMKVAGPDTPVPIETLA